MKDELEEFLKKFGAFKVGVADPGRQCFTVPEPDQDY